MCPNRKTFWVCRSGLNEAPRTGLEFELEGGGGRGKDASTLLPSAVPPRRNCLLGFADADMLTQLLELSGQPSFLSTPEPGIWLT